MDLIYRLDGAVRRAAPHASALVLGGLLGFFGCFFWSQRPAVAHERRCTEEATAALQAKFTEARLQATRIRELEAALSQERDWKNSAARERDEAIASAKVDPRPDPRVRVDAIGQLGVLWSDAGRIPAGETLMDLNELNKSIVARDAIGIVGGAAHDRFALLIRGTRVRCIDATGFIDREVRLRIESGPLAGRAMWVSADHTLRDPE